MLGCTNFEGLRKEKFDPDYATKSPTVFLAAQPENGRFFSLPLAKDYPLMFLKRGLGYSLYQLHSGRIGEVPNADVRLKAEGEKFEDFYANLRSKPLQARLEPTSRGGRLDDPSSHTAEETEETFPILNGPIDSIEPELPEW